MTLFPTFAEGTGAPARRPAGPRLAPSAGARLGSGPRRLFRLPFGVGFALPLALGLGLEAAVALGWVQGRLLPPPSRVLGTLWALAASGELALHAAATMRRVGVGFAVGAALGLGAGLASGMSRPVRATLDPTLQALRAIPSIAWVPLFVLWLGIDEAPKIALIAVGAFFPVYLGVASAVRSVDRRTLEVGRAFRLGRLATARRILLPAILPETVTALRAGLGLGFMFVVAAEFMGASEGLGYLLVDGQQLGRPAQILAAILAFGVLGQASDAALVALSRPLLRWQDVSRERL